MHQKQLNIGISHNLKTILKIFSINCNLQITPAIVLLSALLLQFQIVFFLYPFIFNWPTFVIS